MYTPQTGCTDEEKETFWRKLDEVLQSIPANEKVILAGDVNGHIGADRSGVERWHGGHGYGTQNEEGRAFLQCAEMYDLAIANNFFKKNDQHLITYKSGDRMSTIDYIMVRRDEIRNIKYCKVIPGECVATQHRLEVVGMSVEMTRKPRPRIKQQKTKWWNLEKDEYKLNFLPKAQKMLAYVTPEMNYDKLEADLLRLAKEELGETSGGGQFIENETWWLHQQVKEATKAKKDSFTEWQLSGEDQDREQYKVKKKEAKKGEAIAKENAYEDLYQKLDSREGTDMIYKLAKTRNRRTKDITDNIYISDADGNILTDHEKIKDRWQEYFEELFNVTNARKEPDKCDETEGPIPRITAEEIRKQLEKLKKRKANGPDNLPIELWKLEGDAGIESLETTMNDVMNRGMPSSWRYIEISPIYKGKGSVL